MNNINHNKQRSSPASVILNMESTTSGSMCTVSCLECVAAAVRWSAEWLSAYISIALAMALFKDRLAWDTLRSHWKRKWRLNTCLRGAHLKQKCVVAGIFYWTTWSNIVESRKCHLDAWNIRTWIKACSWLEVVGSCCSTTVFLWVRTIGMQIGCDESDVLRMIGTRHLWKCRATPALPIQRSLCGWWSGLRLGTFGALSIVCGVFALKILKTNQQMVVVSLRVVIVIHSIFCSNQVFVYVVNT